MIDTVSSTATAALLNAVYQNVKAVSDSLLNLMPKVKDEALKNDMTVQISIYEGFASRSAKLLAEEDAKPEKEGMMTKMGVKLGDVMNAVIDSGTAHLAQMVIKHTTTEMNALFKEIREAEARGVSGEPLHLAKHLYEYEEKTAEDMKAYLG